MTNEAFRMFLKYVTTYQGLVATATLIFCSSVFAGEKHSDFSYEKLISFKTIEEVIESYKEIGIEGSREEVIEVFGKEFREKALPLIQKALSSKPPEKLEPFVYDDGGVEIWLFGYRHGNFTMPKQYKAFVKKGLFENPRAIYLWEQDLLAEWPKRPKLSLDMADQAMVLPIFGVFKMARVVLELPRLLLSALREEFELVGAPQPPQPSDVRQLVKDRYSLSWHNLSLELISRSRLPSAIRLQLATENGRIFDPYYYLRRSIYMAGFALGAAQASQSLELPIAVVMGRDHLAEVASVIENQILWKDNPYFLLGYAYGSNPEQFKKSRWSRYLKFYSAAGAAGVGAAFATVGGIHLFSTCVEALQSRF